MPEPGLVYYLPPELCEGPGKGNRPHLVVSLCPPGAETSTFAYGSTKATDAVNGAAHVRVDPSATRYGRTGLSRPTYFYPSRLLTFAIDDLPEPSGRIIHELPAVRAELRRALGFGQGVTCEANQRGANRRGRIAEYAPAIAEELGASHCLVVTEAVYSRRALQQTTIPILSAVEYDASPGDVLVPHTGGWLGRVPALAPPLLLAVPMITSVYERDSLARYCRTGSDATMRDAEAALAIHFGV
jgi:mRNA-degrading endonuclease toxin of MazEF toxin-antitoxin module